MPAARTLACWPACRWPADFSAANTSRARHSAAGDFRSNKKQEEIDEKLRQAEQIGRTEVPPGVDMAQWALAWCLQHEAVSSVIPGCKSVEQVESNAGGGRPAQWSATITRWHGRSSQRM